MLMRFKIKKLPSWRFSLGVGNNYCLATVDLGIKTKQVPIIVD
jgi:hypothetical protein